MKDPLIRAIELLERSLGWIRQLSGTHHGAIQNDILAFLHERACVGWGMGHFPSSKPACAASAALERLEPKVYCIDCGKHLWAAASHLACTAIRCVDCIREMDWPAAERVLKDAWFVVDSYDLMTATRLKLRNRRCRFMEGERTRELYDAIMALEVPDAKEEA